MKVIALLASLTLSPAFLFAAKDAKSSATATPSKEVAVPQTKTFAFNVTGMTCGSCAEKVEAAVMKLDGVTAVSVNHETGRTVVMLKASSKIGEGDITAAIKDAGYDIKS